MFSIETQKLLTCFTPSERTCTFQKDGFHLKCTYNLTKELIPNIVFGFSLVKIILVKTSYGTYPERELNIFTIHLLD